MSSRAQGDNEDVHFEDTVRGSDWGADQRRRAHVRQHRAQGGARARRMGRAVEPRAQGRPAGHHQRPEGHDHRARRGRTACSRSATSAAPRSGAPATSPTAPATRCCTRWATRRSRDVDPGARAHRSARADPRRRALLRRGRARPDHRRADARTSPRRPRSRRAARGASTASTTNAVICEGIGSAHRAGDRRRRARQHGGGAVPPDGDLPGRHPRDRGLPRRRRPAAGRRRPPLHARLRAGEEGARLARRRVAAHGGAHPQGQGRAARASASTCGSTSRCSASSTSSTTCAR